MAANMKVNTRRLGEDIAARAANGTPPVHKRVFNEAAHKLGYWAPPTPDAPRADALTAQLDRLDALLDRLDEIQATYDVCETAVTRAVESIRL